MSTLPQLVEALTTIDERAYTTLETFAKRLRDAGLISRGKSGAGAAQVTIADAANLLIGISASETATNSPIVVATYRALRPLNPIKFFDQEADTFGDALEILIAHANEIENTLFVTFRRPIPTALIRFNHLHEAPVGIDFVSHDPISDRVLASDALTARTIGIKTLRTILEHVREGAR